MKLRPTKQTAKLGTNEVFITNPAHLPDPHLVEEYYEPMVIGTIITPSEYLGPVISLCIEKRGIQRSSQNIDNDRVLMVYDLPLCEIILDFHDSLKSISSGYASFDYEDNGYMPSSLVKVRRLLFLFLSFRFDNKIIKMTKEKKNTKKLMYLHYYSFIFPVSLSKYKK